MRRIIAGGIAWLLIVGAARAQVGPDVIVGDIDEIVRFNGKSDPVGLAIGTWSCNIGDMPLAWEYETPRHPVIAQNMYRLKDGRFEQIGLSWLKHGYYALSENLCFDDCQANTHGRELGVHCADPYSGDVNGDVYELGPRTPVNASTGEFEFPYRFRYGALKQRRLMVEKTDLDPARNPGAMYFVEGHYVTADDAAWGNDDNNASWRRALVYNRRNRTRILIDPRFETVRAEPAILAWAAADPQVQVAVVDVPDDGRFYVAGTAKPAGQNRWAYEYAVFNYNSHRAAQAFEVPLPDGALLESPGFHDVTYRSKEGEGGEGLSGQDWPAARTSTSVRWAAETFDENVNANALRWSTLYNFRFITDRPPGVGSVTLTLFRPGSPGEVRARIVVPAE
ncbi:MAG: hypothetical protein BroJett003_11720 [Planctomycetota bacterium]|nr:MAG: hypothetical protein BroJett003_11720 [Planctomycetota bacterium]